MSGWVSVGSSAMLPQPNRRPRLGSCHCGWLVGHRRFASIQICFVEGWSQSIRMCSSDSVGALQLAHRALCSRFGILSQNSPIRSALLIALYRKVWIGRLVSRCLQPSHIVRSVRACLLVSSSVVLIWSSRISVRRFSCGVSRLVGNFSDVRLLWENEAD